jgi:hypothetical protein
MVPWVTSRLLPPSIKPLPLLLVLTSRGLYQSDEHLPHTATAISMFNIIRFFTLFFPPLACGLVQHHLLISLFVSPLRSPPSHSFSPPFSRLPFSLIPT